MVDIQVKNLTKFFVIGENLLEDLSFEIQVHSHWGHSSTVNESKKLLPKVSSEIYCFSFGGSPSLKHGNGMDANWDWPPL